jgi:hypothetical protein
VQFLFAQEITGAWSGTGSRDVASSNYSYKKDGNSLISSMDSPKQTNIPLGATTFIDNQLSINAPARFKLCWKIY